MAKSNVWGFVIYEESNPLARVMDFLVANHFAAVISPLHDKDVWTEEDVKHWRESRLKIDGRGVAEGAETWECPTGEMMRDSYGCMVDKTVTKRVPQVGDFKKPHRHVYIQLDYSMPLETMLRSVAPLNITYLEVIKSRRAYLRYLAHLDTPEKAQYRREDVIALGGVDVSCLWSQDDGEKYAQDGKIMDIIKKHRFHSIHRLTSYLASKNYRLMYAEVKAHYGYWQTYMRGGMYVVERMDKEEYGGEGSEGECVA